MSSFKTPPPKDFAFAFLQDLYVHVGFDVILTEMVRITLGAGFKRLQNPIPLGIVLV